MSGTTDEAEIKSLGQQLEITDAKCQLAESKHVSEPRMSMGMFTVWTVVGMYVENVATVSTNVVSLWRMAYKQVHKRVLCNNRTNVHVCV